MMKLAPFTKDTHKIYVLDMKQLNGVGEDGLQGPVQINIDDPKFGYTGNGPYSSLELNQETTKAFTLIVRGAKNGGVAPRFTNVLWPFDKQPCFSGEYNSYSNELGSWYKHIDIFNFYWLPCDQTDIDGNCPNGRIWYGNLVRWNQPSVADQDDVFQCDSLPLSGGDYSRSQSDYSGVENLPNGRIGVTGACCLGNGMCVHTTERLCPGYYIGTGTICGGDVSQGGSGGACNEFGACCIIDEENINYECLNLSIDDCVSLNNNVNTRSNFGGTGSDCIGSVNVDCMSTEDRIGACCDGRGNCTEETKENCDKLGNYFMGIGVPCTRVYGTTIINVCSGGTGACCQGDLGCVDGVSGSSCLDDGHLYIGDKSDCRDIQCDVVDGKNFASSVSGLNLQPGDLYGGGMVVGVYQPLGSPCFGATGFGGSRNSHWEGLMSGGSTGSTLDNYGIHCVNYFSQYDYHGYGFTSEKGCIESRKDSLFDDSYTKPDSYYVIVSLSPIAMTGDREVVSLVDYPTSEFYWSNQGSSWGPIYNQDTNQLNDLSTEYVNRAFPMSEGYWYNQAVGENSLNSLGSNTFSSCRKARKNGNGAIRKLLTKPFQSAHGNWHRNWGLYNNVRIIGADNALFKSNTVNGAFDGDDFGPGLTSDYISAFRAIRLLDDKITSPTGGTGGDNTRLSDWFIPSHDELSFIASKCISNDKFDLNTSLFGEGYVPFEGWYWTSTGAFDETKGITLGVGEGIINPNIQGVTADPGSLAWAMNFDINGDENEFLIAKKNRTHNKYKVRPIRLLRCDGQYATGESENVKLWNIPRVLRDKDKNINQD